MISDIQSATFETSFSVKPLLVTAGVPTLIPDVTKGDLGSLGTEFLLTVM